jgi:hypothetical protein
MRKSYPDSAGKLLRQCGIVGSLSGERWVEGPGGAGGCLPTGVGSDEVRMSQNEGSGGCFAAEKAGVCEKKRSRTVGFSRSRGRFSRAEFGCVYAVDSSPDSRPGFSRDAEKKLEFCRVAYKKKETRQNSLLPAPGKLCDLILY